MKVKEKVLAKLELYQKLDSDLKLSETGPKDQSEPYNTRNKVVSVTTKFLSQADLWDKIDTIKI